jgi:hypothetical protein
MDDNVQQVSTMVNNLRNMAIDIGTEVSNQNQQLKRIQEKSDSNVVRVEDGARFFLVFPLIFVFKTLLSDENKKWK